MYPTTDSA